MSKEIEYTSKGIIVNGKKVSLIDIISNICTKIIKEEDLVLIELGWESRNVEIWENILVPRNTAKVLKELMLGKEIYFGEILGKHSEVYGVMDDEDIDIDDDFDKCLKFLIDHPYRSECNHSFFQVFLDNMNNGNYDEEKGFTKKNIKLIKDIIF